MIENTPTEADPFPVDRSPSPVDTTPSPVDASHVHVSASPSPVDASHVSAVPSPVDASPSPSPSTPQMTNGSSRRVRGSTRGKNSSRLINQHGGQKLPVGVSSEKRCFVGNNATKAANELGAQIRLQAPLQGTENWEHVPPSIRATVVQTVRDKFEIEGYDESPLA